MRISDVVKNRSGEVVTAQPDASVNDLLALLAEHKIGAVVVADGDGGVLGIVSERDVVRRLNTDGADLLTAPVSGIMTKDVFTTTFDADLTDVATQMTERRIRHMPVIADAKLAAIVSIGDIVKSRIDALQAETEQLRDYIQQ